MEGENCQHYQTYNVEFNKIFSLKKITNKKNHIKIGETSGVYKSKSSVYNASLT